MNRWELPPARYPAGPANLSSPAQQKTAEAALNQFKEDPDSWLMVDKILSEATYPQTKFLALQVLDHVIMTRWKVLPRDQCQGS